MDMGEEEFWNLVEAELDTLPPHIAAGLDNVAFFVEDEPEDGSDTLGVYEGFDQSERADYGFGELPDRIILYRLPLLALCEDEKQLREEVHITLVHEIAHYYGVDEERLHDLGWG